jgi:hypothetical protein
LGEREVREEVNVPIPVPLEVLVERVTNGDGLVDQTTPRAITLAPPSAVIFPPELAVVLPKLLIAVVEIVGTLGVLEL